MMAVLFETEPPLSTRITLRIQAAGISKRWAASVTNRAKGPAAACTIGGWRVLTWLFAAELIESAPRATVL
jgi:hypothetical protein